MDFQQRSFNLDINNIVYLLPVKFDPDLNINVIDIMACVKILQLRSFEERIGSCKTRGIIPKCRLLFIRVCACGNVCVCVVYVCVCV